MSRAEPQQPSALQPFSRLDPQQVLDALASVGMHGDGRVLTLNSYENRVFLVYLEEGSSVVAKFYRAGRWTEAQILEEHRFANDLHDAEVPAVPPLSLGSQGTLGHWEGLRFSISPRQGGRAPELEDFAVLHRIGTFLGRLHDVGARSGFSYRLQLTPDSLGREPLDWLAQHQAVPLAQRSGWEQASEQVLSSVKAVFASVGAVRSIRLHGDCHPGNILWNEATGPHFVDLDDAMQGPAIQDFWMLLDGDPERSRVQLDALLRGYEQFRDFDDVELRLIEPLRSLRMIHYSAWLARRWADPAFPAAFPWFGTERYWEERTHELRDQWEKLQPLL
jgi:Ser/Thr protein kinase RdoA (MazF antagonist)